MNNAEMIHSITEYVNTCEENYISEETAIIHEAAGMKIYDSPLVGFSSATDPLYTEEFKKPGVIHPDYRAPQEWLPEAKTVISFFVPFSEGVRKSNRKRVDEPYEEGLQQRCSVQWLHARVEGQAFLDHITDHIQKVLEDAGYKTVCPTTSGEFRIIEPFVSCWSERHAAYASGLGTFGLSRGLITEKGMSGRFGSVITDAEFISTERPYSSPFEYCTMCGACAKRCPAGAIDPARGVVLGKEQTICGPYLDGGFLPPQGRKQVVRYGCGKCQTAVPCESGIPGKK